MIYVDFQSILKPEDNVIQKRNVVWPPNKNCWSL